LILNALQATPRGGEVKIDWRFVDQQIVFSVADTGPGIDEDKREQIWRPFFTTRQRGTGLGLAIVRKRMEEAGGFARLAPSRNGEGARVELRLPI